MADETTYDSELNQPAHRPGMEGVVNRGADARDTSGNRVAGERPTVGAGHVDPFSVAGDPAPKGTPKTPPTPSTDGSGLGGRERENTIMEQVAKAGG